MGFWNSSINVLVVLFAVFFTILGLIFLLMPFTGTGKDIEGGSTPDKAVLGVVYLLAASPMFYYVFSKNARGLPPPAKKNPGQPPRPGP